MQRVCGMLRKDCAGSAVSSRIVGPICKPRWTNGTIRGSEAVEADGDWDDRKSGSAGLTSSASYLTGSEPNWMKTYLVIYRR